MKRGLTLIELLLALTMTVFIVAGSASAFVTAINYDRHTRDTQERYESQGHFEEQVAKLLRGAYVSPDTNDAQTYMQADATGNSLTSTAADTITFTTLAESMNGALLTSEDDFETLNQRFGTQGGVAEVSLSCTPVGEMGQNKQGLFIREQRPADGDSTQGGTERVLDDQVRSISFEFWNGSDWDATWSTSGQSTLTEASGIDGRRIPAAIRVTYTLSDDSDNAQHSFIVRLPHSDVTASNPVVIGGTQ